MTANYDAFEMVEYWQRIIREKKDPYRTYVTDPALFNLFKTIPVPSHILDAGCGEGYVSRWLAKQGHQVVGIDASSKMILSAEQASIGSEKYLVLDLTELSFKSNSFDAVVSNLVLMEIENLKKAVSEICRIINRGGKFIFQIIHPFYSFSTAKKLDPNFENYFHTTKITKKFLVDGLESPFAVTWFHRSLEEYVAILNEEGFVIQSMLEPTPISDTPPDHFIRNWCKEPKFLIFDTVKN